MRDKRGITLIEILVAAGLISAIMLAAMKFMTDQRKGFSKLKDKIILKVENIQFEEIMQYDLGNARHSMNILNLPDDQNRSFFDFFFDDPCQTNCRREFTLEEGKFFYLLSTDKSRSKNIIYPPVKAYTGTSGQLNFVSLNKDNFLTGIPHTPWRKNKLILLYSLNPVRTGPGNSPRLIAYLGWVTDIEPTAALFPEKVRVHNGRKLFHDKDPRDGVLINNEDMALQRMPYIAGMANHVHMINVSIIRYYFKRNSKGKLVLMRGMKKPRGRGFGDTIISESIESIKFIRPDSNTPEIRVEIQTRRT